MGTFSSIRKNLLTVSTITTVIVLWLSISFLKEAWIERSDAVHYQKSILQEDYLLVAATHLADERALLFSLFDNPDEPGTHTAAINESISQTNAETRELVAQVHDGLYGTGPHHHHTYSAEYLRVMLLNLEKEYDELAKTRATLSEHLELSVGLRDSRVQMRMFNQYTAVIEAIDRMRIGLQFVPQRNIQDLLQSQQLKSSVWKLSEATRQLYSLTENPVKQQSLAGFEIRSRSVDLIKSADQAWIDIRDFSNKHFVSSQLTESTTNVKNWYNNEYRDLRDNIQFALRFGTATELNHFEWAAISNEMQRRIGTLGKKTEALTLDIARHNEARATRILWLDIFLVLLSCLSAYAIYRILKKIQHRANYDELTELPNRSYMAYLVESAAYRKLTGNNQTALIRVDAEAFKSVNDTRGQAIGDQLLQLMGQRLSTILDDSATLGRTGGDEFSVLLHNVDVDRVHQIADDIINSYKVPFNIDGSDLIMNAYLGISSYPSDVSSSKDDLMKRADLALHSAKTGASDRVTYYDAQLAEKLKDRLELEADLKVAVEQNQFELYFQPQFNVKLNRVNAVEALIRWHHPTKGMISPFHFIPMAEDIGLIDDIGEQVLAKACEQTVHWKNNQNLELRIAVNVSSQQFMQHNFNQIVRQTMEQHGTPPELIEIELTESVAANDVERVIQNLADLRSWGIHVSLDDFGTGFSSLSYLQELPLDALKIDRAFIIKLAETPEGQVSVASTIATLAQSFGLETVAEGVELQEQLDAVHRLGIDVIQGYYYSPPVPAGKIPELIKRINDEAALAKAA